MVSLFNTIQSLLLSVFASQQNNISAVFNLRDSFDIILIVRISVSKTDLTGDSFRKFDDMLGNVADLVEVKKLLVTPVVHVILVDEVLDIIVIVPLGRKNFTQSLDISRNRHDNRERRKVSELIHAIREPASVHVVLKQVYGKLAHFRVTAAQQCAPTGANQIGGSFCGSTVDSEHQSRSDI